MNTLSPEEIKYRLTYKLLGPSPKTPTLNLSLKVIWWGISLGTCLQALWTLQTAIERQRGRERSHMLICVQEPSRREQHTVNYHNSIPSLKCSNYSTLKQLFQSWNIKDAAFAVFPGHHWWAKKGWSVWGGAGGPCWELPPQQWVLWTE